MSTDPRTDREERRPSALLGFPRSAAELDPRVDPNVLTAVARIAPGTPLRQGIDDVIRSREGALIVIGEPEELSFMFFGGIANVQLMPDPTIPSNETGTRHRTAERVAKQTNALVVSISQQRETVTLFVGQSRYQLDPIADVLAKTNQALGTLETYGQRLEQVLTRLTALEFQNAVVLDDVLVVVQRAQMAMRMAEWIERGCVELGTEARLIRLQLEELIGQVPRERDAVVRDYAAPERDAG